MNEQRTVIGVVADFFNIPIERAERISSEISPIWDSCRMESENIDGMRKCVLKGLSKKFEGTDLDVAISLVVSALSLPFMDEFVKINNDGKADFDVRAFYRVVKELISGADHIDLGFKDEERFSQFFKKLPNFPNVEELLEKARSEDREIKVFAIALYVTYVIVAKRLAGKKKMETNKSSNREH